ncbi:MAG: DNA topoisomerase IV subunit B [Planctomycetota bacterium]
MAPTAMAGKKKAGKKKARAKAKKKPGRKTAARKKAAGKSSSTGAYSAKDISVLKGLEPVRMRPAMYIGGIDKNGLHHLVWEIVDNAIDEVINGHATTVEVVLDKDSSGIEVSDNGRGIPVDMHPETKRPALETILTTLHAGGKFDSGNYIHSGGLHGVGSSVVNALSKEMTARVKRQGKEYEQRFSRGKPKGDMKLVRKVKGRGTTIHFKPDPDIFRATRFDTKRIHETLEARAYLHKGLKIVYRDRSKGTSETFQFDEGIKAYLEKLVKERGFKPTHDFIFDQGTEKEPRMEVALQWTDEPGEYIRSYVNGVYTRDGGTHEQGLRTGVVRAVRNYIDIHDLQPRGVRMTPDDLREGLCAVLSIYHLDPQFQGQTKEKLNNPEVNAQVASVVGTNLELYFNSNPTTAKAVVARAVLASKARRASRDAVLQVKRKTAVSHRLNLPGKLADCESTRPAKSELFIVEGDSAGGSAKQARERKTQAILPLRGKVLNTEQASLSKVMENKELSDMLSALGCGMGASFNISQLRYHKIIILTDADSDGHHIMTLLLTFFYRYLPELIKEGYIYLGMPPLYRIDHRGKKYWAWSDEDKEEIIGRFEGGVSEDAVTRFKGLGEMSPPQLKETAMSTESRSLQRVFIDDPLVTDQVIRDLMGKDAAARYKFVMEKADEADDVDL